MRDYDILIRVELDGGNTVHEERRKIGDRSLTNEFGDVLSLCLAQSGLPRVPAVLAKAVEMTELSSDNPLSRGDPEWSAVAKAERGFRDAAVDFLNTVASYDAVQAVKIKKLAAEIAAPERDPVTGESLSGRRAYCQECGHDYPLADLLIRDEMFCEPCREVKE